jgi:Immunoglobulin V-set domain
VTILLKCPNLLSLLFFRVIFFLLFPLIYVKSKCVSMEIVLALKKLNGLSFQVSWFRRKDFLLLTVGLSTYSSDDRFLVEHTRHLGNWALRIKNARKDDEGTYECQLSTHPPSSIFIELRIVGECWLVCERIFNLCGSVKFSNAFTRVKFRKAIVYEARKFLRGKFCQNRQCSLPPHNVFSSPN